MRIRIVLLATLVFVSCCGSPAAAPASDPAADPPAAAGAPAPGPAAAGAPAAGRALPCPGAVDLAGGLRAENVRLPGREDCLTLVRIDPARFELRVHTAAADGGRRTAPGWAADFGLAAVVNTSMFDDGDRSIGILRDARAVNRDQDNPKLGGFLAFDPVHPSASTPPVVMTGRDCPGFDLADLRRRYRAIVQNYRLLDCRGAALPWADPKVFSSAGIALDRGGRVVFLHARAPLRMTALARFLASPDLGLRAAMYVEGGPEASVFAAAGGGRVEAIGSFESGFWDDSNRRFWPIPNVLGAAPR
ncbi:MAG TPA: phosphodiester glycosidase family protein [Kofleriaceae bacterium]|nr:phosphodiester glycosidase family protein [Kofleriaceae bacterium]